MSVVEPSYLANVDVITKRMKTRGLSLKQLGELAPVSQKTLTRILEEGERAHLATYRKLANPRALDVNDVSTLYIDDQSRDTDPAQEPVPKDIAEEGVPLDIEIDEDPATFDETTVSQIVAAIMKEAGLAKSVIVVNIILNSVTLRLLVSEEDIARLFLAFGNGSLDLLKVVAIAIPREGAAAYVNYLSILLQRTTYTKEKVRTDFRGRPMPPASEIETRTDVPTLFGEPVKRDSPEHKEAD